MIGLVTTHIPCVSIMICLHTVFSCLLNTLVSGIDSLHCYRIGWITLLWQILWWIRLNQSMYQCNLIMLTYSYICPYFFRTCSCGILSHRSGLRSPMTSYHHWVDRKHFLNHNSYIWCFYTLITYPRKLTDSGPWRYPGLTYIQGHHMSMWIVSLTLYTKFGSTRLQYSVNWWVIPFFVLNDAHILLLILYAQLYFVFCYRLTCILISPKRNFPNKGIDTKILKCISQNIKEIYTRILLILGSTWWHVCLLDFKQIFLLKLWIFVYIILWFSHQVASKVPHLWGVFCFCMIDSWDVGNISVFLGKTPYIKYIMRSGYQGGYGGAHCTVVGPRKGVILEEMISGIILVEIKMWSMRENELCGWE